MGSLHLKLPIFYVLTRTLLSSRERTKYNPPHQYNPSAVMFYNKNQLAGYTISLLSDRIYNPQQWLFSHQP